MNGSHEGVALVASVLQGSPAAELKMGAIRNGMVTLRMSGIQKVLDGVTTTEEILRVTMAD